MEPKKNRSAVHQFYYGLRRRVDRSIDWTCAHAVRTKLGARIVDRLFPSLRPVLCATCFKDHGLKLDAADIGFVHALACPNCGATGTKKLNPYFLKALAWRFFVRGSVCRAEYGAYPRVQFNDRRTSDYEAPPWLQQDVTLISEKAKIGHFRLWPSILHVWRVRAAFTGMTCSGRQNDRQQHQVVSCSEFARRRDDLTPATR